MARNSSYVKTIMKGGVAWEEELLDEKTRFHDYVMTSLRTVWGMDLDHIRKEWGSDYYEHVMRQSRSFMESGKILLRNNKMVLNQDGMFIADFIIRELFI